MQNRLDQSRAEVVVGAYLYARVEERQVVVNFAVRGGEKAGVEDNGLTVASRIAHSEHKVHQGGFDDVVVTFRVSFVH